ncbi:DUF3365 domain-containing protein [Deferribacteraceae bacterium V6Fe1]|nr:DUF3365 domain-containing protein [Deferribacteraceae bacterium V6Fe1]
MFKSIQSKINFAIFIVLLIIFGAFYFIMDQQKKTEIMDQKLKQAQVIYQQLDYLKTWIGKNGGIWIKDIKDDRYIVKEGRYARKNTSIVLAELSDASLGNKDYKFRVVSPKPLNPKNLSDAFENQALMKFRTMSPDAEIYKFDFDKKILRYVKPMVTSQFCLKCHPNYELGSIEGGISITIPIEDIIQQIKQNRIYYASFFGITMAVLLVIMVYLMNVIVVKPIKKLTDQADKISTGEINVSAEIHREDEIGELSKAIERLRISFKKMMNLK